VLGEEIAMLLRQYPMQRNVTLRLLEPLGAPEDSLPAGKAFHPDPASGGVAIALDGVTVRAAGQTILREVDLRIEAGTQVAIVGASGAGKSSLVGLLLGWHRPAEGRLLVDGEPLDPSRLEQLRLETAWVDPMVRLWNRTLLNNVEYGNAADSRNGLGAVLDAADLHGVLQRLPDGLQTLLGEGGGLVSGGEGQRVRFGRALARPRPRLVILDEPFRGLDREKRRELLQRARLHWQGATLLCITHDVGETLGFDRVVVLDSGRIVADGSPRALAEDSASPYHVLLDAEQAVRTGLWSSASWKRLRLEAGKVTPAPGAAREGGEP
jgi:ATP-binding cassette subfamily B protein